MDMESIRNQVKHNCNISDAKFWGYFSICGLLLRMRELYRSEKGMEFYEPIAMEEISPWIGERDNVWNSLNDEEFISIDINGILFSPFDVESINRALKENNVIYGAGYGRHMKPNFFLARTEEIRITDDCDIFIAGDEFERDIDTVPAMLQGREIFVRRQRIKGLLWEKFMEMLSKKYPGALDFALGEYGITRQDKPSREVDVKIDRSVDEVTEIIVLHEIGEAMEDKGVDRWLDLLTSFNGTKEEYKLRAIKDMLADCSEHGPLKYIANSQNKGLLGFYIILLTGLHKVIFPEIVNAFQAFVEKNDWDEIENVRKEGHQKVLSIRNRVLSIWNEKEDKEEIRKVLDEFG